MFQGPLFQVTIDDLHLRLVDSQLGYKECVSHTSDESMKGKFVQLAAKREQMKHDLEVYGGAMQSPLGTVKDGLTSSLTQSWLEIQKDLKDGAKIGEKLCQEEVNLKKVYDSALKSQSIASSLNGLLLEHIRKLEADLKDLETMFGVERKMSQPSTPEKPSLQRKLSVGDKIKSAFGMDTSNVDFEPPKMERRQSLSDKIKSAFGMEPSTSSTTFEPPKMERRQSLSDKIKSAFGMESGASFEPPKLERTPSLGDKIKAAFTSEAEKAAEQDKVIQKAALSLDERCQVYKKHQTKFADWE